MSIDRAAALRNAEKLIRQGKLEAAMAEYLRVVEEDPRDWNTANALGDLYARAGQVDKAIETYNQIAGSLSDEGSVAKAGAVYKKILKLKPDHEHALLQVADLQASQGFYADARSTLNAVLTQREKRADARGVAQVRVRLGAVDPEDYQARVLAAIARVELDDVPGAVRDLKGIAAALAERGRWSQALEALCQAASLAPDDPEIRQQLVSVHLASGDFASARESATTVEQFRQVAATLEARGLTDEALATLGQAARINPDDGALRSEVARAWLARGDVATAADYISVETAGDDPALLLALADMRVRGDAFEDGLAIVSRLLEGGDAACREEILGLACRVAEQRPDVGFRIVEALADTFVAETDWRAAAAAWQVFVAHVPNSVLGLMRLVEICVDGRLDTSLPNAQALLADAYLATGSAMEARFVAEDLAYREPWLAENIDRLRRALELSGEGDPDRVIADWLSGEAPFSTGGLSLDDGERAADLTLPVSEERTSPVLPLAELPVSAPQMIEEPVKDFTPLPRRGEARGHFELSANAIDLSAILGDLEFPPPAANTAADDGEPPSEEMESVEIDLSMDLNEIRSPAPPLLVADPSDLDGVFAQLRHEVLQTSAADTAEQEYQRGVALREGGDLEGAVAALQQASQAPALRFPTASLLGRIFAERGLLGQAIEWFERAAQVPAPSAGEGHGLLYDFAVTLEKEGDMARALEVFLELQAQAGAYRDVDARADRLTKVQAGG